MSNLSDNIKQYRKKNNLSQTDLANKLFVTKQAVSKWETKRGYPDSSLIPQIAKEMGISIDKLMGEQKSNKKKYIYVSIASFLILLLFIFTPIILRSYKETREYNIFITSIENQTGLTLPSQGTLVYVKFEEWMNYGNSIPINQMSYIVFENTTQLELFESSMESSSNWIEKINLDLSISIPVNIQTYTEIGDYYLVYNLDTNSFNDSQIDIGTYNYLFLIYQTDNQRLIVFDYSISIEGNE